MLILIQVDQDDTELAVDSLTPDYDHTFKIRIKPEGKDAYPGAFSHPVTIFTLSPGNYLLVISKELGI